MRGSSVFLVGAAVLIFPLVSCGGGDLTLPDTTPADIALIKGDNQRAPAGQALAESLVVKVLDRRGQGLSNARVAFTLGTAVPGAQISPDTAETRNGIAQARWVLGSVSGLQTAVATVVGSAGLEVTFSASVGAAGASKIQRVSGDGQRAPIGSELQDPLIVLVTDGFGNPVAGVPVEWTAQKGSVDPGSTLTGADGRAVTTWSLGSSVGPQTATATSADLEGSPLVFTATAASGDADRLERVSGTGQSAPAGAELDGPLVVRLVDRDGNGVSGRAVSWVVATGGGSVSSENSTTDDDGRASTRWTLGPNPGGNSLNAVVSGVGAVGFSATGTSGGGGGGSSPSRLEFQVQPSDTQEDKRISPAVEVVVLDAAGDRYTGGDIEIKLELTGDNDGKLGGHRTERTHSGVATFSDLKVDHRGEYRLHASADGLPTVDSRSFQIFRNHHDD
jgi:hypothetical protein